MYVPDVHASSEPFTLTVAGAGSTPMSAPMLRVTLWLAVALHVLAGLYWALLSTPESNAAMLALSLVLVVVLLLGAGIALDVAVRLWTRRAGIAVRRRDLVLPALRLLPALARVRRGVVGGATRRARRVEASRGSITAAIIARTGWADPEALFTTARWLARSSPGSSDRCWRWRCSAR